MSKSTPTSRSTNMLATVSQTLTCCAVNVSLQFEVCKHLCLFSYSFPSSVITSSSTREYTLSFSDGSVTTHNYLWRQRITFQSCPHAESVRSVQPSQQLSVDQVFVMYDSANQLIRYAMTNKIGPISK